jgi:hypothetical protein
MPPLSPIVDHVAVKRPQAHGFYCPMVIVAMTPMLVQKPDHSLA